MGIAGYFAPYIRLEKKIKHSGDFDQSNLHLWSAPKAFPQAHFRPLDVDVEVYVYAVDVIYSYQLTIPQHTVALHTYTVMMMIMPTPPKAPHKERSMKLDEVISINIHYHIKIWRSKLL